MNKQEYIREVKDVVKNYLADLRNEDEQKFQELMDIIDDEDITKLLLTLRDYVSNISNKRDLLIVTYFIINAIEQQDIDFDQAINLICNVFEYTYTCSDYIEILFNYYFDGKDTVIFDSKEFKTKYPNVNFDNIEFDFKCNTLKIIDTENLAFNCSSIECNDYILTSSEYLELDDYKYNPVVNNSITINCDKTVYISTVKKDINDLDLSNCPGLEGISETVLTKVKSSIKLPEQPENSNPIVLPLPNKQLPSGLKIYKPEKCKIGIRKGTKEKFDGHIVKI